MPYLRYDEVEFDVIVGTFGDNFDRYSIRLNEIRESIRIIRQIVEKMPAGDYRVQDKKVTPPPRGRIDESMEALIHHFKVFTEGFKVPEGEVYVAVESPAGRARLLSGVRRLAQALPDAHPRAELRQPPGPPADDARRPAGRRGGGVLDHRPGDGGGGPVSDRAPIRVGPRRRPARRPPRPTHLTAETIERARAAHRPLSRTPLGADPPLPSGPGAGRLAHPRGHGRHRRPGRCTPTEVFGTASFYDMLHTEPVGTHLVAVCTNIACLLNGAAELLEHAERSLGVNAGGTTADGAITLEEAECLADCDRAPCVQVNHRFVGAQTPETFDRLVAELRSGARVGRHPRPRHPQPGARGPSACRPIRTRWPPSGRPWPRPRRERAAEAEADRAKLRGRPGAARDGRHRRPQDRHRPARVTPTPTPSSATWPPAATRACARRSP